MKILHLITSLDTGGAEKMLLKLLSKMDRKQFDSIVVCLIPAGPVGKQITDLGVPVETLGLKRGHISPKGLFRCVQLIKKYRPDIIQTWLYHADLLGYLASRLTGFTNLIWNIRCTNMDLEKYSKVTTWVVKACAFFSNYPVAILSNSDIAKGQHIELFGYNSKKFEIILNGFDLSVFKPDKESGMKVRLELGLLKDAICIGLVGRYDPQKDHASFIKAAQIVHQQFPDIDYIMAGKDVNPDNMEIVSLLRETSLENRFKLLDERSDVPDIMNALDFCCSSSAFGEGFPNVVGEAMACGVPCVVTDVGHSAVVVGATGIVVPPRQHEALAKAIMEFVLLPQKERIELGQKARQRIELNYSLEKIVGQYEALYHRIGRSS